MKRTRRGFTLVELLVVVAIIALLASLLLPMLTRAKAIARKAACAAGMNAIGKSGIMYMTRCNSYPPFGLGWNWSGAYGGWPKIYGILHEMRIAGTGWTVAPQKGLTIYGQEIDEAFRGALCPAMDAPGIIKWADGLDDYNPGKVGGYATAVGYQWNFCLAAERTAFDSRGAGNYHCFQGRWNPRIESGNVHGNCGVWQTDWELFPGGSSASEPWAAQAKNIDEVKGTSDVAEAWDSFDLTTFSANWLNTFSNWSIENMAPGWHLGPMSMGCNGWVLLNAARHLESSPNILYADGHVVSDATRPIKASDLGAPPAGSWPAVFKVTSWADYDSRSITDTQAGAGAARRLGSMNHIVPVRQFYGSNQ